MTDYFANERAKELEQQNEILRYRVNELQSEIELLSRLLAEQLKVKESKY